MASLSLTLTALEKLRDDWSSLMEGAGQRDGANAVRAMVNNSIRATLELAAALKPFAEAVSEWGDDKRSQDHGTVWEHPLGTCVTIADFRKAREVADTFDLDAMEIQ